MEYAQNQLKSRVNKQITFAGYGCRTKSELCSYVNSPDNHTYIFIDRIFFILSSVPRLNTDITVNQQHEHGHKHIHCNVQCMLQQSEVEENRIL